MVTARHGSPSWTRTNDTAVNSRVLYRLSYGGIFETAWPSQTRPFPVLALPIFPGRLQPSIVGRSELNFRVRDGNGWTLALISTNFVPHMRNNPYYIVSCVLCQVISEEMW